MRARISKTTVDALRRGPRDMFIWDTAIKGFGVKITPAGRRVYLVQYRARGGGRLWRYTIGQHGAWTPDQARREAARLLGLVAAGGNPAKAKRDEREAAGAMTVEQLAAMFLAEHVAARTKPATQAGYGRLLEKFVVPALGPRPAAEVTRADVARFHHSMRRTPYQANRSLAVASKLFAWGERHGYVTGANPCRGVAKFKEPPRRRYLSEAELGRLGAALAEADARNLESPFVTAAIRLLALTGARLSEILTLRWGHVDFERACLRLPESKTGAKVVLLNAPALAVLAALPRIEGNPHVIPGGRGRGHWVNLQKPWRAIRSRAGIPDVRLHDLRHSFASLGAGAGLSLPIIGGLLGHTQASTTQRYAHLADDPLRRAVDVIGSRIAGAWGPPGNRKGGEVTALKAKRQR